MFAKLDSHGPNLKASSSKSLSLRRKSGGDVEKITLQINVGIPKPFSQHIRPLDSFYLQRIFACRFTPHTTSSPDHVGVRNYRVEAVHLSPVMISAIAVSILVIKAGVEVDNVDI